MSQFILSPWSFIVSPWSFIVLGNIVSRRVYHDHIVSDIGKNYIGVNQRVKL